MTDTDAPPDGWVVCDHYPQPGDTILLWRPATSQFETGSWAPARVKDRRIPGGTARMVRPMLGYGPTVPVQRLPVHHYATLGDPVIHISNSADPGPADAYYLDAKACDETASTLRRSPGRQADTVTPTDTTRWAAITLANRNDPCTCRHSRQAHGHDDGHPVCFVCTTRDGRGCQGFTPEATAADRDAFMAGFTAGASYGADSPEINQWDAIAERAWQHWVEGEGEDA